MGYPITLHLDKEGQKQMSDNEAKEEKEEDNKNDKEKPKIEDIWADKEDDTSKNLKISK